MERDHERLPRPTSRVTTDPVVQRQALAGMIWSKQFFYFDVPEWLRGDGRQWRPVDDVLQGPGYERQQRLQVVGVGPPDPVLVEHPLRLDAQVVGVSGVDQLHREAGQVAQVVDVSHLTAYIEDR